MLALVIVELVFAFSVGVGCVLFSINLVRSVYDSEENTIKIGQFPKNTPRENPLAPYFPRMTSVFSNPSLTSVEDEEAMRYSQFSESGQNTKPETANKPISEFATVVKSFTDYIRFY